jgi:hypothetical protein
MFFPVGDWFVAFILTVAIELPVVVYLLRTQEPSVPRLVALVLFANLATHPAVWFIFTQLFLVGTPAYVVAAEGWAVAAEAVFYVVTIRGLSLQRAVLAALAGNAASFLIGRLLAQPLLAALR